MTQQGTAFQPDAEPAPRPRTTLIEAMSIARRSVALFTEMPIDAVVSCAPEADGWLVTIDVVEAPARLGDNDLLATYEMALSQSGEVQRFTRLRRYNRDDAAGGRA